MLDSVKRLLPFICAALMSIGCDSSQPKTVPTEVVKPAASEDPTVPKTRQEFARAMSKIRIGMSKAHVLWILGEPDDVLTRRDRERTPNTVEGFYEVWGYGTNGHLTFPTLGQVYFDEEGALEFAFGHGEPPPASMFEEQKLRELLSIIDGLPSSGWDHDPLRMIKAVNALQPLGKDKALAALSEYARVAASSFRGRTSTLGLLLVLRVLFDVPEDPGYMPNMTVGAFSLEPPYPKRFPRFPVALEDDIPFLVKSVDVGGYQPSGMPQSVEKHLEYFRRNGKIRAKPLSPTKRPFDSLLKVTDTWGLLEDRYMLTNQLLWLTGTVYDAGDDRRRRKFDTGPGVQARFALVAAEFSKLKIMWNDQKNKYTFEDGSVLPVQPKQP